ncbi:MAG: metallophosphoesterase family protein, partial [Treponema sp.]|nr:metallophosphoesterase family protein [Treponema sp.]
MNFLVISDLHGNLDALDKLDEQFKKADAVLFAGDFTKFGDASTGLPALEKLKSKHDTIFSVIGNCDEPSMLEKIEEADMSVQKTLVNFEGLCFAGSGGGSKFTGETANERTDEELASDFDIITKQEAAEWNNLIAVMHNPPKDTECDKVAPTVHVGSPLLKKFIDDYKPLAVITGHIHESAAICKAGNTTVINPGALLEGKYALMQVEKKDGAWSVTGAEL